MIKYNQESFATWDAVVLLHGLFATRKSMRSAQERLRAAGYFVVNWGYPSHGRCVAEHVARLVPILRRLQCAKQVRSINFLTHSFGGIIARCALHQQQLSKTRRAVMLAPPNTGSHLARLSMGPFHRIFPAVREISESPLSLANQTPAPHSVEIGIIAAASDFIVPAANTHLPNQADHCVVPSTHFRLPKHDEALNKALQFMRTGSFALRSENITQQELIPIAA